MRMLATLFVAMAMAACAPQSDVDAARKQAADLASENAALKEKLGAENAALKAQLATQASQIAAQGEALREQLAKKPDLPVTVTYRKALIGAGYVAVIQTTVKEEIPLIAVVSSQALGTTKRFELHVSPQAPTQLGHSEGATFENGDVLTLENANYATKSFRLNASGS